MDEHFKKRPNEEASIPSKKPRLRSASANGDTYSYDHAVGGSSEEKEQQQLSDAPYVDDPSTLLDLSPITEKTSAKAAPLPLPLTEKERRELEIVLEFHVGQDGWREDWSGNLAFFDKEISNPRASRDKKSFKQSLFHWAQNVPPCTKLAYNLLRHVYNMEKVPESAKRILALADSASILSIEKVIRRVCCDPTVLQDDGWTTTRSDTKQGATGGPFLIGAKIRWQESDAIVIAYVHDSDIGDLWKAVWINEQLPFDLEAEEVLDAQRKWERRYLNPNYTKNSDPLRRPSARFSGSVDFTVEGIEHGIVMAASYSKGARQGVYWPARVMHASEIVASQGKRSASRSKVDIVFLAPYWSDLALSTLRGRKPEGLSDVGGSLFNSGPLFDVETVDATNEMIKVYTHGAAAKGALDLNELRTSFRFTGLPKQAFSRYLDSHRLAVGFKTFAKDHLSSEFNTAASDLASAGLFGSHIMSVQAPLFPSEVLHLPFQFILSQLRSDSGAAANQDTSVGAQDEVEPALQLGKIIEAMKPPQCWGITGDANGVDPVTPSSRNSAFMASPQFKHTSEPPLESTQEAGEGGGNGVQELFESMILGELSHLAASLTKPTVLPALAALKGSLGHLLVALAELRAPDMVDLTDDERRTKRKELLRTWSIVKRLGLDALSFLPESKRLLIEWRVASERIYRRIIAKFSTSTEGNGVSTVLSDYRCNGHRTADGCFERPVRLPAAMKGARMAGAGQTPAIRFSIQVDAEDLERIERKVLPMAHARSYLQRMKTRCVAAKPDEFIVLTDDSNKNGGEDTMGSRGTWEASVAAVATAIAGVDKIFNGECLNAFCITRPPGHHAGRSLHCMKAVSNGFCILNPAACVALYAVTPISQGGLGLSRVCVLDFDVHHGNGTQNILCETFDPRFLYVSIHAGGAHVNGVVTMEDDPKHELHDLANNPKQSGIYPGRCGDTSPHEGVLNLPLGAKVTSHEVGLALVSRVTPKVNQFAPDLIILSAGFDAHKNDPMGLGALTAADFGHITEVACQLAFKSCSGRVLSILEGGYGVPCCRPQRDIQVTQKTETQNGSCGVPAPPTEPRPQPAQLLDLGDDLPEDMDDQVPFALQRRLDKCHEEGFVDCVCEHVRSLARCNKMSR